MKNYIVSVEYMEGGNSGQYCSWKTGVSASEVVEKVMLELKQTKVGVYSVNLLNVERI